MLFHFKLRPVANIAPFGDNSLHWFGLTDGWYWLTAGDAELFRYSSSFQATWEEPVSEPYVDYHIARLWEDILEMLPAILAPVPTPLADRVAAEGHWMEWRSRVEVWLEEREDREAFDLWCDAVEWWNRRELNTGYLQHAPRIWLWRVGDTVNIRWDNRGATTNDVAVWQAESGEVAIPVSAFLAEVNSFHDCFVACMAERVEQACREWPRPDVDIDLAALRLEQYSRSQRWNNTMRTMAEHDDDWEQILAANAKLDALLAERE